MKREKGEVRAEQIHSTGSEKGLVQLGIQVYWMNMNAVQKKQLVTAIIAILSLAILVPQYLVGLLTFSLGGIIQLGTIIGLAGLAVAYYYNKGKV